MGFWNCSDSVALIIFIWDIGTVPKVWHYLFFYWALEQFRQCGIICFSIELWKCSDSVTFCFLYVTLELIRECGIIWFSIGLWNCSDSVALLVLIWDFGTVPTVWHYLFFLLDFGTVPEVWHHLLFNWTLDLFRECGFIGFHFAIGLCDYSHTVALLMYLLDFGTVPTVWHY
jgi:hypothetical protein